MHDLGLHVTNELTKALARHLKGCRLQKQGPQAVAASENAKNKRAEEVQLMPHLHRILPGDVRISKQAIQAAAAAAAATAPGAVPAAAAPGAVLQAVAQGAVPAWVAQSLQHLTQHQGNALLASNLPPELQTVLMNAIAMATLSAQAGSMIIPALITQHLQAAAAAVAGVGTGAAAAAGTAGAPGTPGAIGTAAGAAGTTGAIETAAGAAERAAGAIGTAAEAAGAVLSCSGPAGGPPVASAAAAAAGTSLPAQRDPAAGNDPAFVASAGTGGTAGLDIGSQLGPQTVEQLTKDIADAEKSLESQLREIYESNRKLGYACVVEGVCGADAAQPTPPPSPPSAAAPAAAAAAARKPGPSSGGSSIRNAEERSQDIRRKDNTVRKLLKELCRDHRELGESSFRSWLKEWLTESTGLSAAASQGEVPHTQQQQQEPQSQVQQQQKSQLYNQQHEQQLQQAEQDNQQDQQHQQHQQQLHHGPAPASTSAGQTQQPQTLVPVPPIQGKIDAPEHMQGQVATRLQAGLAGAGLHALVSRLSRFVQTIREGARPLQRQMPDPRPTDPRAHAGAGVRAEHAAIRKEEGGKGGSGAGAGGTAQPAAGGESAGRGRGARGAEMPTAASGATSGLQTRARTAAVAAAAEQPLPADETTTDTLAPPANSPAATAAGAAGQLPDSHGEAPAQLETTSSDEPLINTMPGCVMFQAQFKLPYSAAKVLETPEGLICLADHLFSHLNSKLPLNSSTTLKESEQQEPLLSFTLSIGPWVVGVKEGSPAILYHNDQFAATKGSSEPGVLIVRPGEAFKMPDTFTSKLKAGQQLLAAIPGVVMIPNKGQTDCKDRPEGNTSRSISSTSIGNSSSSGPWSSTGRLVYDIRSKGMGLLGGLGGLRFRSLPSSSGSTSTEGGSSGFSAGVERQSEMC